MTIPKLNWLTRPAVSCYHATDALFRKQTLVDTGLATSLTPPAKALFQALTWDTPRPETFMLHLVPLAAWFPDRRELADQAFNKVLPSGATMKLILQYGALLTDLETAFNAELPRLQQECPVQEGALQQAWQTQGEQLLAGIVRQTENRVLPEEATVLLVHPVVGGCGWAHIRYNSLRIETVTAAPVPDLPEVVRLAWLLSQLNLDLPHFSDDIVDKQRLHEFASLAMIPVALAAAQEAELVEASDSLLPRALMAWLPSERRAETSEKLQHWWDAYRQTRPAWPTALAALEQVLT